MTMVPKAASVSYSGPGPSMAKGPSSILIQRAQRMKQPWQAAWGTRMVSAMRRPFRDSAPSRHRPSLQFLLGTSPVTQPVSMREAVPKGVNCDTTGWSLRIARTALAASLTVASSATSTRLVPRTATALSFLEPITAPEPPRPAARCSSFMMQASGICISPAWPMQETFIFSSPSSLRMASCVWSESRPHSADASRISALPSSIHR